MAAGLFLQLYCQLEQLACQSGIVVVGNGIGGQEGVDAEVFCAHGLELLIALDDLFLGEAVLGLAGVVHDLEALFALTQGKDAAGIVAAGDGLGDVADGLLQEVDVGEVIQVDDGVLLVRLNVLFRRGFIRREHDLVAGEAALIAHDQLGQRGAVHAAALLLQHLEDAGGGGGLDGKVFPETRVPGKGLVHFPGGLADAGFVIEMEGSGILLADRLQLVLGYKGCFHG